jgi:hypothetical protein
MDYINWIFIEISKITWSGFFDFIGVVVVGCVGCAVILCILMPDEVPELYYPEDEA